MEIINDFCAITASTNLTFYLTHLSVSTFLSTNPWFTGKVVILSLESDPISAENIKSIKLLHDDIEEYQIKEIDVKPISSKIAKKGWTRESLLEFLFLYAFKIESRGNFYFSNRVFFNRDISDLLSETGISFPVLANQFPSEPDLKLPIDPDLMFIAETEISDETFNEMYQSLLTFNLFDQESRSNSIIKISRHLNIKINRFSNRYLMRTSSYPDSKYTEFIRYHKGIHAIKLNTEESNSHKRIHTYWNHLKNKHSQVKITDPAKISKISKKSEKKEIQTHDYYLNVDDLKLKRNFGKNLSGLDIALYTICDDKFIDGARVMIYSFIRHNPWFNGKVVVLCNQTYSQISLENKSRLLEIYQDIDFQEVDTQIYLDLIENFKKVATRSQLRLVPSLFTFEIFNSCKDHDFLIYIDSDTLVLDDISEVFSTDHPILAAPDAGEFRIGSKYYTFNGGLLVLKKEVHEMNYRQALIDHAGSMESMSLADQTIMNSFFKDEIVLLNSNYNCLKRCFPDNKFNQFKDSIKIVHYVGAKPWDPVKSEFESKYQRIEELWQKEFNLISDKKMELNLITTSYSDLNFKRLKGKTMTTNWGIDLELLDIDYYVCSVAEDELIGAINRSKNKVKKWIITDNVLGKIKNISGDRIELFEYMRSCGNLGKIHMHSKKKRGEIDLPTSGVQMLYIASFMPVSKLNIFGINLYTEKDIFGNFKRIAVPII